ncbi:MAG: S41 family peptidase [Flavobacteriales bacterium]|nr:S41 family peptidase [Flavobacteriales bacterium]
MMSYSKGLIRVKGIKIIGLLILFLSIYSCEKVFIKPKSGTSNTEIFEEYTQLVAEKYGMLEFKKVDMTHLSDSLRPFVTEEMTTDSLFGVLNVIVQRLKDGHSALFTKDLNGESTNFSGYDFISGYPISLHGGILVDNYVGATVAPEMNSLGTIGETDLRMIYGLLPQDNEIAYIRIPSFNVSISTEELETVFQSLNSAKGMIVDIRGNTGGDPILATNIAAYFTDQEVYIGYENFKIGPGEDDFSKSPANLKPASSDYRFLKPVAVLTDRFVYSAATTFCYSVNPLDNVTFIGQRTGGGSGSVAAGYLANGWIWNLSVSEFVGVDDDGSEQHLDNGFEPDINVLLDTLDKTQDEIIERAILELQ